MRFLAISWFSSLLLAAGCASPGIDGAPSALGTDAAAPLVTATGFPTVTDYADFGPFATTNEASPAKCRIYRPETLGQGGLRHPVIVWGNGTLGFPAVYTGLFNHWASHGFVVAAANTTNAGTGEEMIACLDWVLAENARPGSAYEGRIDVARIGASGHSQGGGGAIMVGRDPRVIATAPLMPYTLGLGHDPASQSQQHGPMFLVSGGTDFVAVPTLNQKPVFEATNVPVFWGTLLTAGHTAALGDAGHFRGPMTAWFRAELMGDADARALFRDSCGLCQQPDWKVRRKGL